MEVEAVGDVLLRKLTDLIHDSIAFDNVIGQIEDIRIQLRQMRGFLVRAERGDDRDAVNLATTYLRLLFSAEDNMENYVLFLAARDRRSLGFFQRRGLTLFAAVYDCFGPGKRLRRKIHHLATDVGNLIRGTSGEALEASLRGGNPKPDEEEAEEEICTASVPERSLSDQPHSDVPASLSLVESKGFKSTKTFPANRRNSFRSGSPSPRSSPRGHRRHPMLPTAHPDLEGPTLIGFTLDQRLLVDKLKGIQGETGGVIPVAGPAGSGKTTLVQTIYNLREIKTHFDCRAWVHVPDDLIASPQLIPNLLQQVLKSKEGGNPNVDQLISRVHDSLKDKTYLIVLDHVIEVGIWNGVKSAFPNLDTEDSKVILITPNWNVATIISNQENCKPHWLDELCDAHSWELFTTKSCLDQDCRHLDNGFKDEILRKCKGRPLDIVLLGGLLSTKGASCEEWKGYLSQASWRGMKILPLSYNDLPAHSKLCLLYMALFPSEVDISVRRIHRLWLAEGFISRSFGLSEEDAVEECFNDLVQRNFIKISKLKSDGSSRRCHLPRALRDYLSPKAEQISLFYIHHEHQESESKLPIRRVIEYGDIKNYNPSPTCASSPFYENLRSYISFNFQRNDTPAKEVGNFISKIIGKKGFGVLRVLDLEGVYKPTLPETLKKLFHLRYLGLRWTFIDHLPKSVGDLPYLETLDLKRTYINSLPSSIWKLEHLKHLNLPGIRLDYNQGKRHNSLTELRTLIGLIVDDETAVKDELSQLCELRELDITCQSSVSKDLMSWIQKLINLRFLWLKSKDNMGRPSKIKLEPLSNLVDLSHLSLLGNIVSTDMFPMGLPTPDKFPPHLKVLALSVSQLNADPMAILSQLPHLSVLRLLADSYLGTEMKCPRDGFKHLRVLKLWMLRKLVKWTVEHGGMPQLKELNIRQCDKLKQLPIQLLHQKTLEELTLTTMPEEFVQQVKSEKQSHTILIENNYKFTKLPDSGKRILIFGTSLKVDHNLDDVVNFVRELD